MNTKTAPRFDLGAVRSVAGDTVYGRGTRYYRDGHVIILAIEPNRVLAQVEGTEDYRTVLTGRGKKIGGECSCPAFGDGGFCKHMVATALAANDARNADAGETGALTRIRRHLQKMGVDALAELIIGLAERDAKLFRTLELAATTTDTDDRTLEIRLRKAIDDATRTHGFVEYREAPGWVAGVDAVLDRIEQLPGERAAIKMRLAERAIDRIEHAIGGIDDSDGHCNGLMQRAAEIHLDAAHKANADPVALARQLFGRQGDGSDAFYNAVATYSEILGDAGLAEYRRLTEAAWAKLPVRTLDPRAGAEFRHDYDVLLSVLDFFAERDGDVAARIALRRKDLSAPWCYLRLAQFCLEHHRKGEALRYAEEGLWLFDGGRPNHQLLLFTADLLAKSNRKDAADNLLWRAFEKDPSYELYAHLRKLSGKAAAERVLKWIEPFRVKQGSFYERLYVSILIEEKMFDRAWSVVGSGGEFIDLGNRLAEASEATHPREAVETYAERAEMLIRSSAYAEAVKLVGRMAKLRDPAEHKAYVIALKARHERKRNLMKLLA